MIFECQHNAQSVLHELADHDVHSILIEGPTGSGRKYLANYFAKLKHIDDMIVVSSNVAAIRDTIDSGYDSNNPVVICIENLDSGVIQSAYTMLKFLEEPRSNVYIIVTCVNRFYLPDTIASRCACVTCGHPTLSDLKLYQSNKQMTCNIPASIKVAIRSFSDIDYISVLNESQLADIESNLYVLLSQEPVSSTVWSLGHFSDNSKLDTAFMLRVILYNTKDVSVRVNVLAALNDLELGRIAAHTVVTRMIINIKYRHDR